MLWTRLQQHSADSDASSHCMVFSLTSDRMLAANPKQVRSLRQITAGACSVSCSVSSIHKHLGLFPRHAVKRCWVDKSTQACLQVCRQSGTALDACPISAGGCCRLRLSLRFLLNQVNHLLVGCMYRRSHCTARAVRIVAADRQPELYVFCRQQLSTLITDRMRIVHVTGAHSQYIPSITRGRVKVACESSTQGCLTWAYHP